MLFLLDLGLILGHDLCMKMECGWSFGTVVEAKRKEYIRGERSSMVERDRRGFVCKRAERWKDYRFKVVAGRSGFFLDCCKGYYGEKIWVA